MIKDSQKKKDVAFIMYSSFHWYVYKNIYKHLSERSEFIIDLCMYNEEDVGRVLNDMVTLLESNRVPYKILRREDYYYSAYLEFFFSGYVALVSVWERGCVILKETAAILKINTTYGAGKELTMVRPSRGLYDLILSYGPRDTSLFSLFTTTIPIGNPKFDDFYNSNLDKQLLSSIALDPRKKTILYLPTHSDLSSFKEVLPKLIGLSPVFNVIVKMHYYLEIEESTFVQSLDINKIVLLKDNADLLSLLAVSDIAISDNSSAIFDVIQADKPLLVADFWDDDFIDSQHKVPGSYKRGIGGALTYSGSIEQVIKKQGKVLTFKSDDNLEEKVEECFALDGVFSEHRKALRKELFSFEDSHCGERGAVEIEKLIDKRTQSKKGIMFHSFENVRALNSKIYNTLPSLVEENLKLKNLVSLVETGLLCIVIFDQDLKSSLLSLRSLVGIAAEYTVVVITERSPNFPGIKCYKSLEECYRFDNKFFLNGVLFVNSGIILKKSDLLELVMFIRANQIVDVFVPLPKVKNDSLVKEISSSYLYKDEIMSVRQNKYLYFDVSSLFIRPTVLLKAVENGFISNFDQLTYRLNRTSVHLFKAYIKNMFVDSSLYKESIPQFAYRFFYYEFYMPKEDRYSFPVLLKDLLSDLFEKKSELLIPRIIFWGHLLKIRFLVCIKDFKKITRIILS